MEDRRYSLAIGRGDGLVARTGDAVMYVALVAGAAPLLNALDAGGAAQSPGRALAKALGAIALGSDSDLIPPFGVLAPTEDGLLLILRGPVSADIEAAGITRTLTGDRALTWVDETVREPVDRIAVGGRDISRLIPLPHTDLRSGVVPGGGFVAQPAAADSTAPPSSVPDQRHPQAELRPPIERPIVGPPPRQAEPTAAASASVGALAVDDEAVYPLDRPYVIGRNPLIDKSVNDALASPIFLLDDPQISRVHAYVSLDGGAVVVRDAGTPGGTYLAAPGDQGWSRIGERPTELKPGWYLRIGQRILMYQRPSSAQ